MNILLSTLAIFYITKAVTISAGPSDVLVKLRNIFEDYRGLDLDCFFCTALWASLPFAFYLTSGINVVVYWFALAGGAVVINEIFGGQDE